MNTEKSNTHAKPSLSKAYEFQDVEERWHQAWKAQNAFSATMVDGKPSFSIVIPPPNVTGVLHIGHALNNTLQDILVRFRRMQGHNVLWVPGTDHAGIATQNVVERQLKAEGTDRHAVGREQFIERVWKWKAESGGHIIHQLKRLGCSCDWDRERFTMDEGLSTAVRKVFTTLYREGLIYKGDYIINWCPRCHTALSDLEVEHEPTQGKLYRIRYPYAHGSGYLVVATTRPETMLGDTAVAVHPADERYHHLEEKAVILPLLDKKIPIVEDTHVEMEFGTGALKVTPAHDLNDFEIGNRHDLPLVTIMDENGVMNENAGSYMGLDRFACREQIVQDLEARGLLDGIDEYEHGVGTCYRCHTVVEPRLSKQWFVTIKPLAEEAIKAVKEEQIHLHPKSWENTYYDWMYNIRDWCISRQIWWGHQIPAWTCQNCHELIVSDTDPSECPSCQGGELVRETDVLDTWFSSALWPFSTLGWPEETKELQFFYPTSVLITSFDILFFWVARMIMMGLHFKKEIPFKDVYLHALVRDANGQKMSKSKGNVMDPLIVMEKYGTDAFRFTLTAFAAQGRDIRISEERIEGYRHFINKIWNASRFALMHIADHAPEKIGELQKDQLTLINSWILSRLDAAIEEYVNALDDFRFNDAAAAVYHFTWHEFCDWYLEWSKSDLFGDDSLIKEQTKSVLLLCMESVLKLLHPITPFVTEEIWHSLPGDRSLLMLEPFPNSGVWRNSLCEEQVTLLTGIITGIRNIRSEMQVHPSKEIQATVICHDSDKAAVLAANEDSISSMTRVGELTVTDSGKCPEGAASYIYEDIEIFVPMAGLIDAAKEIEKIEKEMAKLNATFKQSQGKLANEKFLANAPSAIVAKEQEKAAGLEAKLDKLTEAKDRLRDLL